MITLFFCAMACTVSGAEFFKTHDGLLIIMIIVTFVTLIPLACCVNVARRVPMNYILLLLFTLGEGYSVGYICAFYEPVSVLLVVGITAAIVLGLTFYAMYTKTDFTILGGIMIVLLIGLILLGIVGMLTNIPFLNTLYCTLGAILFSVYIIIDTQMLLGKGRIKYSMDDYIKAAINIYLDIINLFLYLLELFGNKQ